MRFTAVSDACFLLGIMSAPAKAMAMAMASSSSVPTPKYLTTSSGHRLAYHYTDGKFPSLLFCGGFCSTMTGRKAAVLEAHCLETGYAFCRFDYRGHGQSSGTFQDCTLSDWIEDTLAIFDHVLDKATTVILVGSSMGGWIAHHVALQRPGRLAGIVGVAAAPDFLDDLWNSFTEEQKSELETTGIVDLDTVFDEYPYSISLSLLEDGRKWNLLKTAGGEEDHIVPISCPVRLLHGQCDEDISFQKSLNLAGALQSSNVVVTLIKDGDHRLSRDQDLKRLLSTVDEVVRVAKSIASSGK
jgi:pimeloyl-ACP methyl ester carboxylesterase